jgi:hypothetical protein
MATLNDTIRELGRELHAQAGHLEDQARDRQDHATSQAYYAAADAVRGVADAIGLVLLGSEDFEEGK